MQRARRLLHVAAVFLVLPASAFAQSGRAAYTFWNLERSSTAAVREYVAAESRAPERVDLPANLLVDPSYRPLLDGMLRRSPAFRRQCLRIANQPNLAVSLHINTRSRNPFFRATTRFSRERPDQLLARVEIVEGTDAVELIAHEIEHVIEQLDEIDLSSRAALSATGIRVSDRDGVFFETVRAQSVGLLVAREVSADGRRGR